MTDYEFERQCLLMYQAIAAGDRKTVEQLLLAGYNPNDLRLHGYLPLYQAALLNRVDIVRILLDYGADPVLARTALVGAVQLEAWAAAAVLLEAGADPLAEDEEGNTAEDLAHLMGYYSLRAMLHEKLHQQRGAL